MKTLDAFRDLEEALVAADTAAGAPAPGSDARRAHALAEVLADARDIARADPGLLLADLVSDPRGWPPQSWKNYFGNACVTVIRTATLRVDVLYWLQNASTLHKHVSSGAFLALSGRRLHLEYDFSALDSLNAGVTFGQLSATGRSMMREAAVSPILPTMVHELYWIEKPAVTVSVRCAPAPGSGRSDPDAPRPAPHRPHEFIAPGAGYLPAAFHDTSNVQRWLDGLGMLRRANRELYLGALDTALRLVDSIHLIHVLDELCDNPVDEVSALLARADAAREDDELARLAPSVPEFRRRKIFSRAYAKGPDTQLLAALLWAGAEGGELAALLKAEKVADPEEFVRVHGERLSAVDPRIAPYAESARRSLR
ncbi:hypothetical protein [Streptomyces marincola]|uniref:hypothetical protein n=1 Tax=Streptomyces marincola TaxID=2878388 RepID=UPI001CF43D88|nr:hypothetical protein [Streptomyces marincola]UCM88674.1 hypothetical protein LC193_12310 [Streptomyces marincola]